MNDRNDKSREDEILDRLADGADVPEDTRCDHAIDDELDDFPQRPRRDDLRELPDDPPGTVYTVCDGEPPPGWDDVDDIDPPPLPDDSAAADCDIDGLGPPLSHGDSGYTWDGERDCPYRIDAGAQEYED